MKRLAAVGAAGVDRASSGPVVHTGAGAAPVIKPQKRGGRQRQTAFSIWTECRTRVAVAPPGLGAIASTCNVTEFLPCAPAGVQIADLDSLVTDQIPITTSDSSAQSPAFGSDTKMIQISCDTQSAMAYGSNPSATTSNMTIPAGLFLYYSVTSGKKVAFILRP